jgi:cytochrome b6-f complex iron-sulfur subunit
MGKRHKAPAQALITPPAAPAPLALAPVTRRDLLSTAGTWIVGLCGAGALVSATRFAVPETTEGPLRHLSLGVPSDFKMRTVTWLREPQLFVVRDERGFGAFSSRCTHLGCTVRRTAEGFACPCHGARYDAKGLRVSGPARRDLPWFALHAQADGTIWVDLSRQVPSQTAPLGVSSDDGSAP